MPIFDQAMLNPQPLPPGRRLELVTSVVPINLVALNPQPLPPAAAGQGVIIFVGG